MSDRSEFLAKMSFVRIFLLNLAAERFLFDRADILARTSSIGTFRRIRNFAEMQLHAMLITEFRFSAQK